MDYKKVAESVKLCGSRHGIVQCKLGCSFFAGNDMNKCIPKMTENAATAITDLLARAEEAEAAQETLQRAMAEYKAKAEKAERERKEAVKLCGKLMALCSPPKEWEAKLFRPCIKRPGDYMGSGYAFLDSFNRIFDEFAETADEETYRAIREAAEQEILDRTRRMIGQKEK